jgi:hypothetical protein
MTKQWIAAIRADERRVRHIDNRATFLSTVQTMPLLVPPPFTVAADEENPTRHNHRVG